MSTLSLNECLCIGVPMELIHLRTNVKVQWSSKISEPFNEKRNGVHEDAHCSWEFGCSKTILNHSHCQYNEPKGILEIASCKIGRVSMIIYERGAQIGFEFDLLFEKSYFGTTFCGPLYLTFSVTQPKYNIVQTRDAYLTEQLYMARRWCLRGPLQYLVNWWVALVLPHVWGHQCASHCYCFGGCHCHVGPLLWEWQQNGCWIAIHSISQSCQWSWCCDYYYFGPPKVHLIDEKANDGLGCQCDVTLSAELDFLLGTDLSTKK